jgi:hypothetical protein
MTVEGYTPKLGQPSEPYMNEIGPNYFATLGVPIVVGRDFTIKTPLRSSTARTRITGTPRPS